MQEVVAIDLKISLKEAQKAAERYLDTQADVVQQIKLLRDANREANKDLARLNKQAAEGDKEAIELAKLKAKEIAGNKNDLRELSKLQRGLNKDIDAAKNGISVYKTLTKRLSEVKNEIKELSVQGLNVPKELAEEFQELDERIRGAEESVGEFQRSVGEYQNATDGLRQGLSSFIQGLSQTDSGLAKVGQGAEGLGVKFKALTANPIIALIAGLAAILGTLFNAFSRSEKGASLMAKATGALNGIMSALVGIVDSVADSFIEFTDDPIQGIENLGQSLVDNVVNRFKGIIDLLAVAGEGFKALYNRDLTALEKAANDAGTALVQITTGLDSTQQQKLADAVAATTAKVIENANAFAALEDARRSINRQNRELTKSYEALLTIQEKENLIADDTTRSFAEREKAAEKARIATEQAAAKEIQLAANNLLLLQREIALRSANAEDVEALRDQEVQALSAVAQAERGLTLAILDNEKTRNELRQDRLERDLDILLDGFDNQKSINERIIANDRETIARRAELLDETNRLAQDSFDKQIETIQQFTGVSVDANELLAESDAVALNERIRALGLSEIIEGRLLEVIRDRRTAVADLGEAQQELNEATQQASLSRIEANRDDSLAKLLSDRTKTEEEIAQASEKINAEADAKIVETKLGFEKLKASEIAALNRELAQIEFEQAKATNERKLKDVLDAIQIQKNAQIAAVRESELTEKEKTKRIAAIESAAAIKSAETRLSIEELTAIERSNLELQLITDKEAAAISSEERILAKRKEALEQFGAAATQIFAVINNLNQARTNRELSALDNQLERELEAAEGNEEAQEQIREDFAQRREEIEQEAFERQKKFAQAQAVVNGALAITKILAETPKFDFGVATAVQIALATATTAAQLAVIDSQEFALGGVVPGGDATSHSNGGVNYPVGTGFVANLQGDEAVIVRDGMRSNRKFRVEGTTAQIASALNSSFGGVSFADSPDVFQSIGQSVSDVITTTPVPSAPLYRASYMEGGQIPSGQQGSVVFNPVAKIDKNDMKALVKEVVTETLRNAPDTVVKVQEINRSQDNLARVENSGFVN